MSIFHCKIISETKPVLIMNESKEDISRNKRRVEFNKSYHKGDTFLTSFEMGLMRQLDMFKQEKRLAIV
jgi:hypothetical protein